MCATESVTVSPFLHVCVVAFGAATWIDLNGVWVELPLIVHQLPEGWNLPSYMAIIVQMACIGPIIYSVFNKLRPQLTKKYLDFIILVMLIANCVFTALLAGE